MKKVIKIEDKGTLVNVLGIHDTNIKRLNELTGAKIYLKKNEIQIFGSRQVVDKAYTVLEKMTKLVKEGATISIADVEELLAKKTKKKGDEYPTKLPNVFRGDTVIEAKSDGQNEYLKDIEMSHITFCIGPSGTGKTFLAVFKAVEQLQKGLIRKIILVRPAVEAGEKLGYLPGDIEQKFNPYLIPLFDSLNHFLETGILREFISEDIIETAPLAYMRGRTLSNSFVILDEAQNTTPNQMKMFLTRFGENSKFVITGDITQIDLQHPKKSGLTHAKSILSGIVGISVVELTKDDVVRHPVVHKIVNAYEKKGRS